MRNPLWLISSLFVLCCAGCTATTNPLLSGGPGPRVEDCAQIQQATPTKYVCGGKTYTSIQLVELRNKAIQAEAAKPQKQTIAVGTDSSIR